MAKATKKVDYKKTEKTKVMEIIEKALKEAGYTTIDGVDCGFTSGTLVAQGSKCDIQIKPITPKAGVDRYEILEEEEETEPIAEDSSAAPDPSENAGSEGQAGK